MIVRNGLLFGFVIWAGATAVFVPFGHYVVGPDNPIPAPLAIAASVAATYVGLYVFGRRVLRFNTRPSFEAAALLGVCCSVPGLTLDGSLYAFGGGRYPGLDVAASGTFASGLLFAYAAALLGAMSAARSRLTSE